MGKLSSVLILAAVVALSMAPAVQAVVYTLTLENGETFLTRYEPLLAAWDETQVIVLTEFGNEIALDRDSIVSVSTKTENRGWGTVIDTTTIALGLAPNDAVTDEEMDPNARLLAFLENQAANQPVYDVQQFGEPPIVGEGSTGGIPVGFTNNVTPPMGGVGISQPRPIDR